MAPGGARRAQLLLELEATGGGGWILAPQLPFAIGIIEPACQPQLPFDRPLRTAHRNGQGRLGGEQLTDQTPGPCCRGLLQGPLKQDIELLGRQIGQQADRLLQALAGAGIALAAEQQQLAGGAALPQGLEMVRHHLQSRTGDHAAVRAPLDRQRQGLQLAIALSREALQRQGRPLMVEGGIGGTPLQGEPLHLLSARSRAITLQNPERAIRCLAAEQHIGIGQHHRQRLGGRMHGQQALTHQPQPDQLLRFDQLAAERIEALQAGRGDQLGESRLAEHRGRHRSGRPGGGQTRGADDRRQRRAGGRSSCG